MAQWAVFTRDDAKKMAKLVMWLMDLPRKGTNVGGGIHACRDDAPPNPCPRHWVGWTTRHVDWIKKPSNTGAPTDEFAIRLTQELQASWLAKRSQLTPVQRQWIQDHIDIASDLEQLAEWKQNGQLIEGEDVEPDP